MATTHERFDASNNSNAKDVPNIIIIPLKNVLLHTTVCEYPEYETKRPLKPFISVPEAGRNVFLNSIALQVIHVVIDPLYYDEQFLNVVKEQCVNVKRLTLDANLQELTGKLYKKLTLNDGAKSAKTNGEEMCRKLVNFIAGFNEIEELYFGPMLHWIEKIYEARKWGFGNRFSEKASFYIPQFSSDFIYNLNPNLKVIFFGDITVDSFDLRDLGSSCPVVIKANSMSKISGVEKLEGGPAHTCLNKAKSLKTVSIKYFENCYHSDTVEELVLRTLSGDNKVHEMFPNLKKIRVKMFCPFIMDMSNTGNAGLYDGVVLDELEVEEQIPCFCNDSTHTSEDYPLQRMLYLMFVNITLKKRQPTNSGNNTDQCHCTDVAGIGLLRTLKVIKLRCFDATVARFIFKLQANGFRGKIVVYEKSRFEENLDHHSLCDHLDSLAETIKMVPHDKIEVIMKKKNKNKMKGMTLSRYMPEGFKISFSD